jgi:excisionase family DNA binding protein
LLVAVAPQAVSAALEAMDRATATKDEVRNAILRELENAKYEATLAGRRHESVDPAKRLVARELEARWEAALKRVHDVEGRIVELDSARSTKPQVDRQALLALATDLPAVWNDERSDMRTKQRIVRILIQEVIVDLDDGSNEAVLTVHWAGGRHTEVRVSRTRTGRYPDDRAPSAVEVVRKMGGQWPDRELAVTMNRMRCKGESGRSWTEVAARQLRERLGIAPFDPSAAREEMITVDEAARRLSICVGSVKRLIEEGTLPGAQVMPSAPWRIPVAALETEPVRQGVQRVMKRRPSKSAGMKNSETLRLPGV